MIQQEKRARFTLIPGKQADVASDQSSAMTTLWLQRVPTAAFNALLDQADPQSGVAVDAATRTIRRLCGRWLAVRRLHLRLTSALVAKRIGLDEPTFLLLESGLTDRSGVPAEAEQQLCPILAANVHDPAWVATVLSIALGQTDLLDEHTIKRVTAELRPSPITHDSRTGNSTNLAWMDLTTLVRHCLIESERFYRGQPHDTRFSYELFRRALVDRNETAWEHIYSHYSSLVESWVRRSGAFLSSGESSEFFVVLAFTKFWRAISPERFAAYPTLAALLHYLQLCAGCAVIESVRAQSWAEMLPEEAILFSRTPWAAPDEEATDRVNRQEFWYYINTQLKDEAERVVVFSSFILGMKPGDIYNQRRDLFASVNDVYNVKRNVLGRLSRNQELRQLLIS